MISAMDLLVMFSTMSFSLERFLILSGAFYYISYNLKVFNALNFLIWAVF
jgi:hypothetical protein